MDTDENSSNSSSCTVLEIDGEEETWNSTARRGQGKRKSNKRGHLSRSDSNEKHSSDGGGMKKKRLKKKAQVGVKSSGRKETVGNQQRKSIKGKSGKAKALSSTKINNIGIHGFESEPIFSQVLRSKNGFEFSENDSEQTVMLSDDDNKAGGKNTVRIPSIHFSSSDGEVDTDEEDLPTLVKPHCRHKNSDFAGLESSRFTVNQKTFSTQDIEDKEFWSDQEGSSSDDDTPILQLNLGKITAAFKESKLSGFKDKINKVRLTKTDLNEESEPQNTGNWKKVSSSNSTSYPSRQLKQEAVDNVLIEHGNPVLKAGSKIKDEFQMNITNEESEDETQPFDDDLPDLSPPPDVIQSPRSDSEREQSPEIFKEEEPSVKTEQVCYTQMDDCIYIEDSEEEELSQSLFQQEVKLELDDSSDSDVEDGNEESWREILCLDDSDDGSDTNERVYKRNDPEETLDTAYEVDTQLDADLKDPYTSATQIDRKDPYTSATQIDRKDPYMSATQIDRKDPYTSETQTDNHLVCSSDSEDYDIYNSATQVDQNRKNNSRNEQKCKLKDLYLDSTQVDSRSSIYWNPSERMEAGHREVDPYSNATQVDVQAGKKRSITQVVRKKNHLKQQQEDTDPYACCTQVENDSVLSSCQVEERDPFSGATQVDVLCHSPDSDAAHPQVDHAGSGGGSSVHDTADEEGTSPDPYDIQTQIDTSDHKHISDWDTQSVSEIDEDDIILLTELESQEEDEAQSAIKEKTLLTKSDIQTSKPFKQSEKVATRNHQTENLVNVYELATQVDYEEDKCVQNHSQSLAEGSEIRDDLEENDKKRGKTKNVFDLYQMETQVTDQSSVKQDEEPKSSESWSDMELYECDTQVDFLNDFPKKSIASETLSRVHSTKKSSVSSSSTITTQHQTKSPEKHSDDLEIAKLDGVESSAKKNSRQDLRHSSYNPPMLKRVMSSNQRPVIPISPQREKSTKEKREQFKARSFYSKKQLDLGESGRRTKETDYSITKTLTSHINAGPAGSSVETDRNGTSGWLSKATGKTDYRKRRRAISGGAQTKKRKEEVTTTVNMDAIIKAKAEMIARNWVKPLLPEPVRKASISTSSNFTEDVEMPELEEVMRKQLPLLTTENRRSHSSPAKQGTLIPHQQSKVILTTENRCSHSSQQSKVILTTENRCSHSSPAKQGNINNRNRCSHSSPAKHGNINNTKTGALIPHQLSKKIDAPIPHQQSKVILTTQKTGALIPHQQSKVMLTTETGALIPHSKPSETASRYADNVGDVHFQTHKENERKDTLKDSSYKSYLVDNKLSDSFTKNNNHKSRLSNKESQQSSSLKDKSSSVMISNNEDLKSSKNNFEKTYAKDKNNSREFSSSNMDSVRRSSAKDSSSKYNSRDKDSTSRPSYKDKNCSKDRGRSAFHISKECSVKSVSKESGNSKREDSKSKDTKERSHSKNSESLGKSSSKDKECLRTSHLKQSNSAGKSSSKHMNNSERSSSSKSKDSSGKSSSKDRDSSKDKDSSRSKHGSGRSHSKDEESSKKLNSDYSESSGKSNSKDQDNGLRKTCSKDRDTSRRSSSREKDSSSSLWHGSERHLSKNNTSLETAEENFNSGKFHSKDKYSLKSSKKDKDNIRDKHRSSISSSKHSSRISSSKQSSGGSHLKDKNGKSTLEEKDIKRSSSKEYYTSITLDAREVDGRNVQKHINLGGNGKENSSSSSSRNSSLLESIDIPIEDTGNYNRKQKFKNLNSEHNEVENNLAEKKVSDVLKLHPTTTTFHEGKGLETNVGADALTSPNGSSAPGMVEDVGCVQQTDKEEEEEDVKLGKLAKAAAIEKLISSQEMEEDGSNVIIIDDDDLDDDVGEEKKMETSTKKKPNFVKVVSGIKSILNKEFRTFFADKNDESARRGQCVKFRLASDHASLRTQKYVNSLIQKKKGGVQPAQSNIHQLVSGQQLTHSEGCRTAEKQQGPCSVQKNIPRKLQAVSSMDSACVATQNRQVKVNGSRSAGVESDHCSQFFKHLLKWNPAWFAEAEDKTRRHCFEPPPVSGVVFPIPEKFDNYKDYVDIFIPHLLQEAWEQSYQSWKTWKNRNSYPQIGAVYSSVEKSNATSNAFERYTWYSIITKQMYETMRKNDQLGDKFLVIIKDYGHYLKSKERKMDEKLYQPNYWDQIGYIEKIQPHTHPEKVKQTLNTFKVLGTDPSARQNGAIVLCLTILSRRRPLFKHLLDKLSFIQPLASLVTTVRQFNAVSSLPKSPLCQHILSPGQKEVFYQNVTVAEPEKQSLKQYNDSQRLAICTASKMILQDSQVPKIGLLQGPPGTGKSLTVVGIVEKFLQLCGSHLRICLCAPSNNAVDLLIKRLDDHKKEKRNTGFASALSIVRIGNTESIHKDVKKFSLSDIVQEEATKLRREKKLENIPSSVRANYDQMKQKMEQLRNKRNNSKGREVERLTADLRQLERRVKEMEKDHFQQIQDISLTRAEELSLKQKILQSATIVCGTLSAFGQYFIFDLLSHRKREGKPMFDCVIVDEASQANELDCIIPLQYEVNKFILVGDPEQLPPTVTSSKAARNYFGQSLFERFYRHFQSSKEDPSPILMLDTQYRMHPDIAYWPSQYIYQGKLKTDRSLRQRYKENSRLKPFVLFDVEDSLEHLSQTTGSVNNPTEVEFIVQLSLVILKSTRPQNIGIIAPYKSQKRLLFSSLSQNGVRDIEISTVDGFQGREKEVIIFSCVRAKSQSGSIGFMADRKRMNVALTRAKSALYIVAHLDSLQTVADWKNLIGDATRRNLIYSVASGKDFTEAAKNILIQK
ncbi:probable helicase senataxin [Saccostrea echinata]|uniref:probable helicase senataxin n=1 Tax=Saccostrea echinata TaxID=191078 RepID=UPI002A83FED3|nr:probable helicase senataxin [Saccostrea echinata]